MTRSKDDLSGVISDMQRVLVISHLKQEALAEAMKVLVDAGPAAAVEVLMQYTDRIVRLGGSFEEAPNIPMDIDYEPVILDADPTAVPHYVPANTPEKAPRPGYPLRAGTRVELLSMQDVASLPPGTRGTVQLIDAIGTVHVKWDTGTRLGLIPNLDSFRVLGPETV